MSNTQQSMNLPPRDVVVPNVPETQTNMGTLEHTGLPIEPIWQITDIPPDFTWMTEQWKFHTTFEVKDTQLPGDVIYTTRVVQSDASKDSNLTLAQWHDIPFACSKWWNGKISYRFTIVKPPRVVGKLLIRYRQDCFDKWNAVDAPSSGWDIKDSKMRSILKEWDLGQSSQFEFDITGSNPIRARPTHLYENKPQIDGTSLSLNDVAEFRTPYILFEMGRISIEVAQTISPGGIFPSNYIVIVEKCLKDSEFMTPTDPRTDHKLTLYNSITES